MIINPIRKLLIILPFYFLIISFIFICSYSPSYGESLEPPIIPNRPAASAIKENLLKNTKNGVTNKKVKKVYLNNAGRIVFNARFSLRNLRFAK